MWLLSIILLSSLSFGNGLLFIDRVEFESNPALENSTLTFFHDVTGNSVTTATFTTFVTITKMMLYIKLRLAEDKNDKEYKRQLVSSVIEIDKVLKGFQSNIFIKHFFEDVQNSMDFKFEIPLPPVRSNQLLQEIHFISIFDREHTDSST